MSGLSVRNLSFHYGAKQALDDVTFDIERGAFCALLGQNGAGKSTLFGLLTRLFVSGQGAIQIAGHDLARSPRAALAKIGVVFQQTTLDLDLSVEQNLRYFSALHGISGRDAQRRIDAALDRMAMRERKGEKARALNGGHRRRAEIARTLIHRPSVLLLDEPSVGLDAATRAALTEDVHAMCAEEGLTVLWATHLTDEVRPADRLLILHRGTIRADGVAGEIAGDLPMTDRFLALTAEAA
ncbi:MAG: ABC transporter ATP-binding protein [Pseudomonadota bacterium]